MKTKANFDLVNDFGNRLERVLVRSQEPGLTVKHVHTVTTLAKTYMTYVLMEARWTKSDHDSTQDEGDKCPRSCVFCNKGSFSNNPSNIRIAILERESGHSYVMSWGDFADSKVLDDENVPEQIATMFDTIAGLEAYVDDEYIVIPVPDVTP